MKLAQAADNNGEKPDKFSLVRRPTSAVEKAAPGAKRILSCMIADTLALARVATLDLDALVREGKRLYNPKEWTDENLQAAELFLRAAEAGHSEAQFLAFKFGRHWHSVLASVGECGLKLDTPALINWLRKSAESGFAEAQYNLGVCYESGDGVVVDEGEAVKWYRKAAEQNHAEAQYIMGDYYENGDVVTVDEVEAVKWYRKAAEQNHAQARYQLGDCYRRGQGVPQNMAEAVRWYRKAAEQEDADAQYKLGMCYQDGQGVAKDEVEAEKWKDKARKKWRESAKSHPSLAGWFESRHHESPSPKHLE